MFTFGNPISAYKYELTAGDANEWFEQGSIRYEECDGVHGNYLVITMEKEFSPYGENGPLVRFVSPELPRKPGVDPSYDNPLQKPNPMENDLFRGGFYTYGRWASDAYPCFKNGFRFLVGSYDDKKDTFTVHDEGFTSAYGQELLVLSCRHAHDEKAAKIAAEVTKTALRYSNFTTTDKEGGTMVCDVYILRGGVKLSRNGKLTKGCYNLCAALSGFWREASFLPVFEIECIDDGVMYSDAWVIDDCGSFVQPSKLTESSSRSTSQLKQWDNLHASDMCLWCQIHTNGKVYLDAAMITIGWQSSATELQRRRMYLIRQQIVDKIQTNQKAYKAILEDGAMDIPDWGMIGQI